MQKKMQTREWRDHAISKCTISLEEKA